MKLKRLTVAAISSVLLFALTSCGLTNTTDGLSCTLNSDRRTYTVNGFEICEEGCYDVNSEDFKKEDVENCTHHATSIKIANYKKWPVSNVGVAAFAGCTHITSVEFGKNVEYIEASAFNGCTGLTSLSLPKGLKRISSAAFAGCTGLTAVSIPGSVTELGSEVFIGCTGIETLTIADGVTTIGASAFKGCESVSSVIVPDSVTEIGSEAFAFCKDMQYIVVGANVTTIGASAFSNCKSLKKVYYAGNLPTKERNVLFNLKTGEGDTKKVTTILYVYSEEQPTESGRYWHYVDGTPTEW
ncbi:MAG: leucine-rich repeat domain-containing protein [Clostridia bacterium]|nr:leucine-rich repeat domain-containing protein [Clostridia bacterium]